jgi:hypothetical protein
MIKVQASVSKGWLHKHGGFNFNQSYYLDPYYRMQQDIACHEFIRTTFPEYPLYNMEDNLVQAEHVVPKMILVGAIQPNMIIAAALGAEFVFTPDKDSDIKGLPLRHIKNVDELPSVEDTLQLPFFKELEKQYINTRVKHPDCIIIPPFFWDLSGRATIHGIITTSMKFIGQDIFTKMMMDPELVKGIHQWITNVYIAAIKHFSELGNLPVTSVHVGECSGTMLDEQSYREFVTPFASQLGRAFEAVRLHSCGNADHVIGPICEIENLKIVDTGSNTSLSAIRDKMGKTFEINVFPPVKALVEGANPEYIKQWLTQTLKDNNGGNLKIEYHLEADYSWENCNYIHMELERLRIVERDRLY